MQDQNLNNTRQNTLIITGCSSGIGRCLAFGLHRRGYRVIASCRNAADVKALINQDLECLQIDLADANSIDDAIDEIRTRTGGRIYGLVNNGAYGQPGAVIDLTREALTKQFETNVFGTQQLTNGLLPMMLPFGEGRVVQISSILGFICLKFRGAYNASKYALEALTDTMRLEHAQSGIEFSLIEPGPITSRFRDNAYQQYLANIDTQNSMFHDAYLRVEKRLKSEEEVRFTLPAEAVLKPVIHALESRRPKIRYPVTVPTRLMAKLKRILPDRWMDWFLLANGDK